MNTLSVIVPRTSIIIMLIMAMAAAQNLRCTCDNGFATNDDLTEFIDLTRFKSENGCRSIVNECILEEDCENGQHYQSIAEMDTDAVKCTPSTQDTGNLCKHCGAGFYLKVNTALGTRECTKVSCPDNSIEDGTGCICLESHYKSTWTPKSGADETADDLRQFGTTDANNIRQLATDKWPDVQCLAITGTCREVANCADEPTCATIVGTTQRVPYTGTCSQCDDGYTLTAADKCGIYSTLNAATNVRCQLCVPATCTDGTVTVEPTT